MLTALNPKDGTVLLVEDNPDDVVLETKALQTFGIKTIYHATTAEEAFEFLQKHACDVVLLDHNLPGANGLKLLEHIRELNPDIRVILVTGVRDERIAVSGFKLGATDYVSKDELLTSGIIRALQGALREQNESRERQQRDLLGSGEDKLGVAREQIDWLLDTTTGGSPHGKPSDASAPYEEEGWMDIRDAFVRYLQDCFRRFPEPAVLDEDGLVRMFRGAWLQHSRGARHLSRDRTCARDRPDQAALRSHHLPGPSPGRTGSALSARALGRADAKREQLQPG